MEEKTKEYTVGETKRKRVKEQKERKERKTERTNE